MGLAAKEGKDPLKMLQDFGKEADVAGSKTATAAEKAKALTDANKMFGPQGGADMLKLLQQYPGALTNISSSMKGTENAIDNMGEDSASISDKMNKLKNSLEVSLAPIGDVLLNVLKSVIPALQPVFHIIEVLGNAFAKLPGPLQLVVVGFAGIVAVSGPMFAMLNGAAGGFGILSSGVSKVFPMLEGLVGPLEGIISKLPIIGGLFTATGTEAAEAAVGMDTLAASEEAEGAALDVAMGPVGWAVLGLTALAAGLAVAYETFPQFKAAVNNAGGELQKFGGYLMHGDLAGAGAFISRTFSNIGKDISSFGSTLMSGIGEKLTTINWSDFGKNLGTGLRQFFMTGLKNVSQFTMAVQMFANSFGQKFLSINWNDAGKNLGLALKGEISGALGGAAGAAGGLNAADIGKALGGAIKTGLAGLGHMAVDIGGAIANWIQTTDWGKVASELLSGFIKAIAFVFIELPHAVISFIMGFFSGLFDGVDWNPGVGQIILEGLKKALLFALHGIVGLGKDIVNAFEGADWGAIGSKIWAGITGALSKTGSWLYDVITRTDWGGLLGKFTGALSRAGSALWTAIQSVDWGGLLTKFTGALSSAGSSLWGFIKGVDWGGLLGKFTGALSSAGSSLWGFIEGVDWGGLLGKFTGALSSAGSRLWEFIEQYKLGRLTHKVH